MARERQQKYFEKDWIRNKENLSFTFYVIQLGEMP